MYQYEIGEFSLKGYVVWMDKIQNKKIFIYKLELTYFGLYLVDEFVYTYESIEYMVK